MQISAFAYSQILINTHNQITWIFKFSADLYMKTGLLMMKSGLRH